MSQRLKNGFISAGMFAVFSILFGYFIGGEVRWNHVIGTSIGGFIAWYFVIPKMNRGKRVET